VQPLPQTVLAYIRKHDLFRPGDRVGVAVSGGADSVALFRLLLDLRSDLGLVLSAAHFNHQLRGAESDEDQNFVAALAAHHEIEFHCASGNAADHAVSYRLSLETAARNMRYEWFRQLLQKRQLNRIATAHTLGDQAETVILRLARGAGTRGLAGIYPELVIENTGAFKPPSGRPPAIVRPLLSTERKILEAYLKQIGQSWREDQSNRDLRHARNRVRHSILPSLERELNPAVQTVLADTAEIARTEEDYWADIVRPVLTAAWKVNGKAEGGTLELSAVFGLPLAFQRRLIRATAESLGFQLEFRHIEEILMLASKSSGVTDLPEQWRVSCQRGKLCFARVRGATQASEYEYRLAVPGTVDVPQIGSRFEAVLMPGSCPEVYNREHLLDRACLGQELVVRNWRPGDRFWPAHRKEPKKIKELLQEHQVVGSQKKQWPVILSGSSVVWARGFPVAAQFQLRDESAEGVLLQETALDAQNARDGVFDF
jgi:tRNA(Ile)-lysidine synthase